MVYKSTKAVLAEIKHIMDLNDIPAKELAHRLNTSQQNISRIFVQSNPTFEKILKICDALDIQMDITFITKDDTK